MGFNSAFKGLSYISSQSDQIKDRARNITESNNLTRITAMWRHHHTCHMLKEHI